MSDKLEGLKRFLRKEIQSEIRKTNGGNQRSVNNRGVHADTQNNGNLPAVTGGNDQLVVNQAEEISRMLSHEALFSKENVSKILTKGTLKIDVVNDPDALSNYGRYAIVKIVETNEIKTADYVGDVSFKLMPGNYNVQAVSHDRQSYGMAVGTVKPGRISEITVVLN